MATQYDIKPGTFETVAGEPLGTFVLNEWTHFELDGVFKFLVANPVVKVGAVTVPGSAYELKIDTHASTQETAAAGASRTLYGQMRIINVSYVGVALNFTGDNYGTYVSNESSREAVTEALLTKVQSGSDSFIKDREPVEYAGDSGLSIVSANSGEVALWDAGPVYGVAGTLARLEGVTATATGALLNQNKNPLLLTSAPYWYLPKDEKELLRIANQGQVVVGEMSVIHDRAHANYQQNLLIGKRKLGGTMYNISLIHLDGTVVTGNTVLENLLTDYPYLDIFAPLVVSTRTLIDMGGKVTESMTAGGGYVPTMGEVHDDYMQRTKGSFSVGPTIGAIGSSGVATGVFGIGDTKVNQPQDSGGSGKALDFDTVDYKTNGDGTPGSGRTAHAAVVTGCDYIVVIQAA